MRRADPRRLFHTHARHRRLPHRRLPHRRLPLRALRAWLLAGMLLPAVLVPEAAAQLALTGGNRAGNAVRPPTPPLNSTQPVTFIADGVEYDRDRGLVTATGNVEAWQNDHVPMSPMVPTERPA